MVRTMECDSINKSSILLDYPFFLHSSMVEHAAVNRGVAGSSPAVGVMLVWRNGIRV